MQYLLNVIDERTASASDDEMDRIRAFNDDLRADGHWVFAGGLTDPGSATVIDGRGGRASVTDGPFAETKEYVAGLWIIEAPDLDVALHLATGASRACNRRVELRPLLG